MQHISTPAPSTSGKPDNRSEKLPDIPEYDGDTVKLDLREDLLIQHRYPNHAHKITYAESCLTISKRAHNLKNRYRKDGLSTIST